MVSEKGTPKIMTEPLPRILDEIEDSIRSANAAARDASKRRKKLVKPEKRLLVKLQESLPKR